MRNHWYAIIGAAAAMLGGCGSNSQAVVPPTVAQSARSWMAPAAKSKDLLYISDVGTDKVYVYSYPQGSLVGTLSGFDSPVRECSDGAGDVFITNTNAENVIEFTHGGSRPVATYDDKGFLPEDCSVDPSSGTLAVTNYGPKGSNTGSVAIYASGKTTRKIYQDPNVQAYISCTYDGSGDLFVAGLNDVYNYVLIELPKGAKTFEHIKLKEHFSSWGGVKWDGKHIAVSNASSTVYDLAVSGTKTKLVRTIKLTGALNVLQFWIDGSVLIGPDGPNGGKHDAGFWKYPAGGRATKTIGSGLLKNPSAATISLAQ